MDTDKKFVKKMNGLCSTARFVSLLWTTYGNQQVGLTVVQKLGGLKCWLSLYNQVETLKNGTMFVKEEL